MIITMDVKRAILFLCLSSVLAYEDVTLVEYIDTHSFIYFKNLLAQAGLSGVLSETGPYTVFVPTDAAFANISQATLDGWSTSQLRSILKYHIVDGFLLVPMVTATSDYTTLLGETVTVGPSRASIVVNGISHVDETKKDNIVNNGVIQPVDRVLMPPDPYLTAETLAQILILDDVKFKDILLAFMMADMINILDLHEFTVFAPTDAAFAKHAGNILRPGAPDARNLYQEVLKYHIVPGARRAEDLTDGLKLFTLHGTQLTITRTDSVIMVNNVTVSETDIFASNGFIHAIDDILFPADLLPPAGTS